MLFKNNLIFRPKHNSLNKNVVFFQLKTEEEEEARAKKTSSVSYTLSNSFKRARSSRTDSIYQYFDKKEDNHRFSLVKFKFAVLSSQSLIQQTVSLRNLI